MSAGAPGYKSKTLATWIAVIGGSVGLLGCFDDCVDVFFVLFDELVTHREIMIGIDCAFLRHQIAHMAVRRQHLEIFAEVFVDRLRLGG